MQHGHLMDVTLQSLSDVLAAGLVIAMLVLLELGRRLGRHRLARDGEGAPAGTGPIDGAVFALLGLLIAFTFSGAATRFDTRRDLIVQEANHIGTAWLRLDVLPESAQPRLRELFRQYLDARLAAYEKIPDVTAAYAELARSTALQGEIWKLAVAACQTPEGQRASMLVLPALNAMIDITTVRTMATKMHPPVVIYLLLIGLALVSALLAGLGMAGGRQRSWVHMIGFALIMGLSVYVIVDLEFPRLGVIRVDAADELLRELRQSMQ